jgi:DNA invertase Pin-like site-specific DNA recombinase
MAPNQPKPLKFLAYYRVSTHKQRISGLGRQAQEEAVRAYVEANGGILVDYREEVESGKRKDRPKLLEALKLCRVHKAILVVAKLDRLARNVAFVSGLMEAGVDFRAVDYPTANKAFIQMLSVFAEYERDMISARTKAALQATKKNGKKLGGYRGKPGTAQTIALARAAKTSKADRRASDLGPVLADIRQAGHTALDAIARQLNERDIPTPRGKLWRRQQVGRLLERIEA